MSGFTPDNGSLIGTDGVDVLLQVNNNPAGNVVIALGDNDIVSLQQTVSPGVLADYTVYGGSGNDTINFLSSPVDSLVQGEEGNDIININTVGTVGGAIIDSSIRGGAGNDIITLVATGAGATGSVTQGGSGVDAIYASGIFGTSSIRGGAEDDTIRFITDSTLVSSQLNGGLGDDLITNNSGTLYGSARRVVTAVVSTISGNSGSDTIDFASNGTSDLLVYGDQAGAPPSDTTVGVDGADNILTDAGDDTIFGGGANDTIVSESGSDSISGGDGNDNIIAGTEDDNVTGDAGDDTIQGQEGDDTIDGGSGNDSIVGGTDDDLIYGQSGNDTILGDEGGDTIDGGSGNDSILGGLGNDEIFGDVGNDEITGDDGNDTINGSFGADTLSGSFGADLITNGDGADVVVQNDNSLNGGVTANSAVLDYTNNTILTLGDGVDVVTDFGIDDKLQVAAYTTLADGFSYGADSVADVANATNGTSANATIVYFKGTWDSNTKTFSINSSGNDVILNGAQSANPDGAYGVGSNGDASLIVLDNFASQFNNSFLTV